MNLFNTTNLAVCHTAVLWYGVARICHASHYVIFGTEIHFSTDKLKRPRSGRTLSRVSQMFFPREDLPRKIC